MHDKPTPCRAALLAAIEAVEKAKEGHRQLSDIVLRACGYEHDGFAWVVGEPDEGALFLPNSGVTESLDAALTLVNPSEKFYLRRSFRLGGVESWYASIADIEGVKETASLATCLAALHAKLVERDNAPDNHRP